MIGEATLTEAARRELSLWLWPTNEADDRRWLAQYRVRNPHLRAWDERRGWPLLPLLLESTW